MAKKRRLNIPIDETNQNTETLEKEETNSVSEALGVKSGSEEEVQEEKSEIIDLNDKSKSEQKQRIDFSDQKFIDDLVAKKTNKVEEEDSDGDSDFKGKSAKEVRETIDKLENDSSNDWTADDFYNVAEIIITVLDTFLANMLRIYAKDTKDSEYSLSEKKKKTLVKPLAAILIKYQAKLKVEFLFIFSLILIYAGPCIAAHKRRKRMKQIEKEIEIAKQNGVPYEEAVQTAENMTGNQGETRDIVEEAQIISETEESLVQNVLPADLRKKKGRGSNK